MRRSSSLVLITVLVAAPIACGEAGDRSIEESVAARVAEATGAEPSTDAAPCEILDDELIRGHFEIGAAEITRNPSRYSPHPLCTASWPKPDAAEIERKAQEGMAEYMTKKMQGEDVDMPSFRTEDEVSLTLSKEVFGSREQALAAFDSAMRVMSEGKTVELKSGPVESPTYDLEPVEGVGMKAMWAPELHQLSVVTTGRIFHVGVRTGGGEGVELEQAKALARDIAGAL